MARPISALDLRFDWPRLRLPIFFIVDDPAPCLNLAFYEQYFEPHARNVPNTFTAAWADVVEEFEIRGKFSVPFIQQVKNLAKLQGDLSQC